MSPDIGQIVLYSLTEEQADEITRRRQGAAPGLVPGVVPGDTVPMLVGACASGYSDGITAVAGRLLIDDDDENWWVTSVTEGMGPGAWRSI